MKVETGMVDEHGAPIKVTRKERCSSCKRRIALRADGVLRGHGYGPYADGWCKGSHLPPRGTPPCGERCPGECGFNPDDADDPCAWAFTNLPRTPHNSQGTIGAEDDCATDEQGSRPTSQRAVGR